ncbi:flagellar protein FlaG [Polynucleobacter sp. MWH-HuK1]|uniref:flagellar protein FlaG n=1 Tax=Polynucleobacter sp. MWH-HuK1 TaxID=1743158 RepID=UPI001C0DAA7C|nr:flagellar protein FlaG [Polynucleobacter sp. MWH-HuK1]MBU3565287.1 flagellar protein FlaG [Polynucleobacter sp. MWH-HuK1]
MSTINTGNSAAQAAAMQVNASAPQAVQVRSDAEVVAKVAATVIKPSSIDQTSQPAREVVAKAAADLQNFVQSMGRNLSFSVDETTGYHVVRVVNPNTGELVRQLPSEELLKVARDFQRLNNALVSQRA